MINLPVLTIGVMTYKRPHYALPTLYGLREKLSYRGERHFVLLDGGSSQDELAMYQHVLRDEWLDSYHAPNLAAAHNILAGQSQGVGLAVLDDYELREMLEISNDIDFLVTHEAIGALRYSALGQWDHSIGGTIRAELLRHNAQLYWQLDKSESAAPHVNIMAAMLYHRRFWDAYGRIDESGSPMPGECELRGANLFHGNAGPTIAWPMRFGDTAPFVHIGYVRSEDYARRAGDAWGAIDVFDDATIGNVRVA